MGISFRSFIISLVLFGLLITMTFGMISKFSNDNHLSLLNTTDGLGNSSLIILNSSVYKQVGVVSGEAENASNAYIKEGSDPILTQFGFYFKSIIFGASTFFITSISILSLFLSTLGEIIGVPAIVIDVILGLVTFSILFAIWRVLRAGE